MTIVQLSHRVRGMLQHSDALLMHHALQVKFIVIKYMVSVYFTYSCHEMGRGLLSES